MAASLSRLVSDLIGAPFTDGGRDKNGLDCLGLAILVRRRMGRPIADPGCRYDDIAAIEAVTGQERASWQRVSEPAPGDIVALVTDSRLPGVVQHIGIYLGDGRFVHTTARHGVAIAKVTDRLWAQRIEGYYRQ